MKKWSFRESHSSTFITGWYTAPTGKPVIHFLHGNGFCSRAYEPMLSYLSDDFDLWLCDVQGHGDSDTERSFMGWDENAEFSLRAFLSHRSVFGDVPAYAVGHSFGGVLTSLILARHPTVFARAVLLDPVWFPPKILVLLSIANAFGLGALTPFSRAATRRTAQWATRDDVCEDLKNRGTYKHWCEELCAPSYGSDYGTDRTGESR